jgi:long-chain acyl-CoA synthetase
LDEDGYLTVVDRKKDMLIYKGYNVYPRELEEILFQHPAVANCTVIGKPVAAVGEIPKAFVVLARGREAAEKELMDFVAERVAPYKRLRELEFVPEIPVNPAGKVLKRLLRERETG